jgi:hypothetical protein
MSQILLLVRASMAGLLVGADGRFMEKSAGVRVEKQALLKPPGRSDLLSSSTANDLRLTKVSSAKLLNQRRQKSRPCGRLPAPKGVRWDQALCHNNSVLECLLVYPLVMAQKTETFQAWQLIATPARVRHSFARKALGDAATPTRFIYVLCKNLCKNPLPGVRRVPKPPRHQTVSIGRNVP